MMTKKEEGVTTRGAGKVAFWARRESIEKMLEEKYTLMATYLAHKKDVNIKYAQFRRYVNEFIRTKENGNNHKQAKETATPRKPAVPFKRNVRDDVLD